MSTSPGFLIAGVATTVLSTATWSEMKRLSGWNDWITRIPEPLVEQVLAARRPDWFDEWAEWYLTLSPDHWPVVRRLQRTGLGQPSDSEAYLSGMLAGLDPLYGKNPGSIADRLREDSELLQHHVWRLFEVQRAGSLSFASRDSSRAALSGPRGGPVAPGWLETFVTLASEGTLSRTRMLEESLRATERGFPDAFSRWFPKLHEALEPTLEERREYLDRYCNLLRSSNPSSVTFALTMLESLETAGALPIEIAAPGLSVVLMDRTRARARQGVSLLDRLMKRAPEQAAELAGIAAGGLWNGAAEVQKAAWNLVVHVTEPAPDLIDQVRQAVDSVAPTLRASVLEWLQRVSNEPPPEASTPASVPEPSAAPSQSDSASDFDHSGIPEQLIRAAGIPQVQAARAELRLEIPPVDLSGRDFPRLHGVVPPITSLEELIDVTAAVVENIERIEDLERVLDGISRLCAERPATWDAWTAPLRKRTLDRLVSRAAAGYLGDDLIADILGAVWAWLTGEVPAQTIVSTLRQNLRATTAGGQAWPAFPPAEPNWLRTALSQHVQNIAMRASIQQARPMLSTPTHQGGWIDPRRLVERASRISDLSTVPEFEQVLSILRLAPDHAAAARQTLESQPARPEEYIAALKFALGADLEIGPTAALWCAAARARGAFQDAPAVAERHSDQGPHAAASGTLEIAVTPGGEFPGKIRVEFRPRRISLPSFPTNEHIPVGQLREDYRLPEWPVASSHLLWLLHDGLPRFWLCPSGPQTVELALTLWPACATPLLARSLFHLIKNRDGEERLWATRAYLVHLCQPDCRLDEVALLWLVSGMASKVPGEPEMAIEATSAGISDGRLDGAALGRGLRQALESGLFKVSRWAACFREVTRHSRLHGETLRVALEHTLCGTIPSTIRDLHQLLELYLELQTESGRALDEETRAWLKSYTGGGKGKAAVKALLALQPRAHDDYCRDVLDTCLAGRQDRARRWWLASSSEDSTGT